MLQFAANVGEDLVHGVDLVVAGITRGDGDDLLIRLLAINHVQETDGADFDETTGETGLGDEGEDVEGVAVLGESAGDEAIVAGVVDGGVERAVKAEKAEFTVVLILIDRPFGDFDDHADEFGGVGSGIQIVQLGRAHSEQSSRCGAEAHARDAG